MFENSENPQRLTLTSNSLGKVINNRKLSHTNLFPALVSHSGKGLIINRINTLEKWPYEHDTYIYVKVKLLDRYLPLVVWRRCYSEFKTRPIIMGK